MGAGCELPESNQFPAVGVEVMHELASRLSTAAGQIDTLQSGVSEEIKNSISSVNMLAQRIAGLNNQIAAARGAGHTPNDLLDQRDSAVKELSGFLQVTTVDAPDGSMSVFVGGGQKLVLGAVSTTLVTLSDTFDPSRVQIGVNDSGSRFGRRFTSGHRAEPSLGPRGFFAPALGLVALEVSGSDEQHLACLAVTTLRNRSGRAPSVKTGFFDRRRKPGLDSPGSFRVLSGLHMLRFSRGPR